jgi:hypothetical protein
LKHLRYTMLPLLLAGFVMSLTVNADAFLFKKKAPVPCPTMSVVVLDFSMAPRVREDRSCETGEFYYDTKKVETEKDIRGYWFGSQDVYYNENMGRIAADLFTEALCAHQVFQIYRRADLKLYYADKKDVLKSKFKMSSGKLNEAILTLNPVAIGQEIGVEKVIVGHICDAEMRKNRTFGPWSSAASFTISIYDVKTGQLDFSSEYADVDSLSSQYSLFEKHAEDFVDDVVKHYTNQHRHKR